MAHCNIFNVNTAGFVFETVLSLFGTINMNDTSKVVKILPVVELKSFQMPRGHRKVGRGTSKKSSEF